MIVSVTVVVCWSAAWSETAKRIMTERRASLRVIETVNGRRGVAFPLSLRRTASARLPHLPGPGCVLLQLGHIGEAGREAVEQLAMEFGSCRNERVVHPDAALPRSHERRAA